MKARIEIEMPKSCTTCFFYAWDGEKSYCWFFNKKTILSDDLAYLKRSSWCPLVEVDDE